MVGEEAVPQCIEEKFVIVGLFVQLESNLKHIKYDRLSLILEFRAVEFDKIAKFGKSGFWRTELSNS